ncbi:hypothetical protein [Legionella drancourtii]|uniref:SAM-dependent methyltransferase n=1 Tax=Legionella drancourtii LLAP12 TaxID=658187 RepID=G9EM57_9GAMM|nr:hypothetical protein [Legionella drancourtii]EHL31657.1 hypothetical protein LDG_6319 [Legionella drancourtii LLAP12]
MRKLVLWGHSVDEYREMFDLSQKDMNSRILEYGCGPSAVNAQQVHEAHEAVSCDPLFVLDKDTLFSKAVMIFAQMADEVRQEQDQFDFSNVGGLDKLIEQRQQGMKQFFADYEQGKAEGRYYGVEDYHLPYPDFSFDFALSAHYLFADLEEQTVEFHLNVIRELARVAAEVRIFPLIDRKGNTSELLGPVLLQLQKENYGVEVREVDYHLHKAENAMLRIWAQKCDV